MPKQLPLSQGGYSKTANGLWFDPAKNIYFNDNAEQVDFTGKPVTGQVTPTAGFSGTVAGTPVKQPDMNSIGSFIANLRNSVKNGSVDTLEAKNQLQSYMLSQFADDNLGNFSKPEQYNAYQSALSGGMTSLFQNLGTIKNTKGQFGETDLLGNFRTTSTTVNTNTTSLSGGTSSKTTNVLPLDIAGNLGPGSTGADVTKLQEWLKTQGYFPKDQATTGYYGDITRTAVANWQKASGINAGADAGYFGPKSKAYLQQYQMTSTKTAEDESFFNSDGYKALPADQQAVARSVFNSVASNDTDTAAQLSAALNKAKEFADPYFKAQISIALDTLVRGFTEADNKLQFDETSLNQKLSDLRDITATSKEFLTLDQQAELKKLEQTYTTQLETVQNDLSAAGFGDSSRRTKTENLLSTTKGDLVESTNRAFAQNMNKLNTNLNINERDTAQEIERLKQITAGNKTDLGRKVEGLIGSENLPNTAGYNPLGGVTGSQQQDYYKDVINATQRFVF